MGNYTRAIWLLLALTLGVGCASPRDDRVQDYNADGVHLYQQGDYAHAAESFQAALALKPDDTDLMYNLAEACDRRGDTKGAEKYYNDCLQRDPLHASCRFGLASLLVRTGRREEAVKLSEDWLKREPKRADAYALDGWLSHQAGDLPRAQGRLQQALEMDPQDKRALVEMALIYEAMNRPGRAVVLYERVLSNEPNQPEVKKRLDGLLTSGVRRPQPE